MTELEAAIDELKKHGAEVLETVIGGKHQRLFFKWQGKRRFKIVPLSGSDWRGPLNARAEVRHMLGIKREKVTGQRRVRRHKIAGSKSAEPPAKLTPGRNPFIPLIARNPALVNRAWAQWFGSLLREYGHMPVTEAMR